jgi:hypothetical protein
MIIIMLTISFLLQQKFVWVLICGCVAVLWTGWPFLGVIVFPFGIFILYSVYATKKFQGVFFITVKGIVILIVVFAVTSVVDVAMYGKV